MINVYSAEEHSRQLTASGLAASDVTPWLEALEVADPSPDTRGLDADVAQVAPLLEQGWAFANALPLKSQRSPAERQAGETLVRLLTELTRRFCQVHREAMYAVLTRDYRNWVRVDDLVWTAAERWPGLLPTQAAVNAENKRIQADKDGLEIQQGVFLAQIMNSQRAGTHLLQAMLRPKAESLELLKTLQQEGRIDLGQAKVEVRGQVGYVTCGNPHYLNAEDESVIGPQETAIDLVLLHPEVRMGVLRGDVVQHPRYKGRRVFDAGINLTKIYNGQLGYLSFYIVRDFGLVNKLYRGLAFNGWAPEEPEQTHEKPWIAVLDSFAIGGGCQLLLVVDYVIAESGAYFNLPAGKEGIIPGAANLRLPRFMGERKAQQAIMFDKTFYVDSPEAAAIVNEAVPRDRLDARVEDVVKSALSSGMVSAGGNRKAIRVLQEPLDDFRRYMAAYCEDQAYCHLSDQLIANLEKNWNAKIRQSLGSGLSSSTPPS